MKAVLLNNYGGVDQLDYTDAADPKPAAGEVLVKLIATSINPIDYKVRRGDMKERMPLEFPAILGRDLAGEVVALRRRRNYPRSGRAGHGPHQPHLRRVGRLQS